MNITPKNRGQVDKLKETHSQRHDATLSEIYELIFHNETLVRSELKVLQDLVQNKLLNRAMPSFYSSNSRA